MPAFTATELSIHHLMDHHPESLTSNVTDVALWTQHIQDDVWEASIMDRAFITLAAGDQPGSFKQAMSSPDRHRSLASLHRQRNQQRRRERSVGACLSMLRCQVCLEVQILSDVIGYSRLNLELMSLQTSTNQELLQAEMSKSKY